MDQQIRHGVEQLFINAPQTKKVQELKEELISNLELKYQDLMSNGKTDEEAYGMVMESIGDVDELIASMTKTEPFNLIREEESRKKTAAVVTLAIGMYIVAILTAYIIREFAIMNKNEAALIAFIVIAGGASCLLIYHFMSKPKYIRVDTTIVEEFKEWKDGFNQKRQIRNSVISIMWLIVAAVYLTVSFTYYNWYRSWIIILIGVAIDRIIRLIFELKNGR